MAAPPVTHLLLGGGGFSGLDYLGILHGLQLWGHSVRCVGGVSIGAFLGALFAADVPMTHAAARLVAFLQRREALEVRLTAALAALPRALGVYSPDAFLDVAADLLRARWPDVRARDLTLAEFEKRTGRLLRVAVTDLAAERTAVLGGDSHPDLPLLTALRAAIAVPGVMAPVCWRDAVWMDGGVTCEHPARAVPDAPRDATLVLLLRPSAAAPRQAPAASLPALVLAVARSCAFGRFDADGDSYGFAHTLVVRQPAAPFLPLRLFKRGARLDLPPARVWTAYHSGLALFCDWRRRTGGPH